MSWILKPTNRNNSQSFVRLLSTGTAYPIGQVSSNGQSGFYNPTNTITTALPLDTETTVSLKYENGVYTYGWGEYSVTQNVRTYDTLDAIGWNGGNTLKEYKWKPL